MLSEVNLIVYASCIIPARVCRFSTCPVLENQIPCAYITKFFGPASLAVGLLSCTFLSAWRQAADDLAQCCRRVQAEAAVASKADQAFKARAHSLYLYAAPGMEVEAAVHGAAGRRAFARDAAADTMAGVTCACS